MILSAKKSREFFDNRDDTFCPVDESGLRKSITRSMKVRENGTKRERHFWSLYNLQIWCSRNSKKVAESGQQLSFQIFFTDLFLLFL